MSTSKELISGAIIGFFAGLAVAIGGAVKDAPIEGFKPVTFMRSPVVGTIVGAIIKPSFHTKAIPTFLATIGGERIVVETYKVIRAKVPSKFEIGEWGVTKPTLQG